MKLCTTVASFLFLSAISSTAVEISPSTVIVASRDQAELLTITDHGRPVPAPEIGSIQFLVGDHSYGHMIDVERVDGGLIVRPTPDLEIGTYDLRVTVGSSRVVATVIATLEQYPDSIENQATAEGLTPEEFRRKLGLYSTGRHIVRIELPEQYEIGRIVRLNVPAPERVRYEWRVNGEIITSGYGAHLFEHTLRRPGEYRFEYLEQNFDGGSIHATAVTRAVEPDPRVVELTTNRAVLLLGPVGFSEYVWFVDGKFLSEQQDLTREFETPAEYRVECIATGDTREQNLAFQKVAYRVIVRSGEP